MWIRDHRIIAKSTRASLAGSWKTPLMAFFRYFPDDDPLAVYLSVWKRRTAMNDEMVSWVFARSLLARGLHMMSGIGDVSIWPRDDKTRLVIALDSPDGSATLEVPWDPVYRFFEETCDAIPLGGERVDVDAVLAKILA